MFWRRILNLALKGSTNPSNKQVGEFDVLRARYAMCDPMIMPMGIFKCCSPPRSYDFKTLLDRTPFSHRFRDWPWGSSSLTHQVGLDTMSPKECNAALLDAMIIAVIGFCFQTNRSPLLILSFRSLLERRTLCTLLLSLYVRSKEYRQKSTCLRTPCTNPIRKSVSLFRDIYYPAGIPKNTFHFHLKFFS